MTVSKTGSKGSQKNYFFGILREMTQAVRLESLQACPHPPKNPNISKQNAKSYTVVVRSTLDSVSRNLISRSIFAMLEMLCIILLIEIDVGGGSCTGCCTTGVALPTCTYHHMLR